VDLGTPQNQAQQTSGTQPTQADPWGTAPLAQNSTPAGDEQPAVSDNQPPAAPAPESLSGLLQQEASRAGVPLVPVDAPGSIASSEGTPSGIKEYTIQPGDSLSKIVARHLGRYTPANEAILLGLNPRLQSGKDRIIAGQKLMVPATASAVENLRAAASSSPRSASPAPRSQGGSAAGRTYVVKEGDTLWSIAAKQLGSGARHEEILKLNAQKLSGAHELQVGMKLKLPG
jgi:nucleoid-associated protein YgaU